MTTTTTLPGVRLEYPDESGDLRRLRPWLNIIRRLRSATPTDGTCVVKIAVIVVDGVPFRWTAPKVTPLEPKGDGVEALVDALSE